MARRQATEEQRAEVRAGIRRAAAKVYREKGVSGVSARAIALAAGVSVGTIYAHFGDLPSLMQSLWMEPLEDINARFVAIAAAEDDPRLRLRALMSAYVQVSVDAPDLYRNAFLFVRPKTAEPPARQPMTSVVFAELIERAICEGQASGQVKAGNPARLTQRLWAGLHGAIALPVNFDRIELEQGDHIARDMIDALLAQIT